MSSGFISEAEIAEQRRIRQEEWERVRTADQPLGYCYFHFIYYLLTILFSHIYIQKLQYI